MDDRFKPAQTAIQQGDTMRLEALIAADPGLATARSSCSHPTLLQCLVLTPSESLDQDRAIEALANRGAELTDPLIAACGVNNAAAAATLLALGADIEGNGRWSPLEEALYWGARDAVDLLVQRGASVDSLRKAAGLGRMDALSASFTPSGALTPAAGRVRWPWFTRPIPDDIACDRQQIIDNALVYAAAWCRIDAARELIARGANVNARPAGFDFTGTPLHYAALNGRWRMADFLLGNGADPAARDAKVDSPPDGWAQHGGHGALAAHLAEIRTKR